MALKQEIIKRIEILNGEKRESSRFFTLENE
jgi:hypothetical protein